MIGAEGQENAYIIPLPPDIVAFLRAIVLASKSPCPTVTFTAVISAGRITLVPTAIVPGEECP